MRRGGPRRRQGRTSGFSLLELLMVMAIVGVLVSLVAIAAAVVKKHSTRAAAKAHIQLIAMALGQYHTGLGAYPSAAFDAGGQPTGALADHVLHEALTHRNAGGENRGWAGASADWAFLARHVGTYSHGGAQRRQILDPWGRPYYYIAHTDYRVGVRVHDPDDDTPPGQPNLFGATPTPDDFDPADRRRPPPAYYGPPPGSGDFFCPDSFQLISKGPDGLTDTDACDRGTAPDDVASF